MIEAIFEAYFSHARDISKIDVLVDIAKTVGLNGDEVKQFLEGREFADKVVHEAESKRRQFRVTGVPFFLISRYMPYMSYKEYRDQSFIHTFLQLSIPMISFLFYRYV